MKRRLLAQVVDMCDCEKELTVEERFGVPPDMPCSMISIGLLEMYKAPIDCYLKHSLHGQIGISREELEAASVYLGNFIQQKQQDPDNCEGVNNLLNVRVIMSLILKKGACL